MGDRTVSLREDADETLEARFCSGDESAMEAVYRQHGSLVYSLCRRTLGPERAADTTQEVFFAAWKSRERYDPESGSLAGWLVGIARFKIIDLYRVERRTRRPRRLRKRSMSASSRRGSRRWPSGW